MAKEKKLLCDTCVYKYFCDEVRTRKCNKRVEGTPRPKDYDVTLAAQGYYDKK